MRLTFKNVFLIAVIAFILGSMPSLVAHVKEYVYFSLETGLQLHPKLYAALADITALIRKYAWHITFAYTMVIAFVIFMENQNPDRTILWLITLVLLPVVGLIIYSVIGPEFSYQRSRRKHKPYRLSPVPRSDIYCNNRFLLERLLFAASGAEITLRNRLRVFTEGGDKYAALEEDLKSAVCCINMQYFGFKDDSVGTAIGEILAAKAREGLKVRLLYDAVGSWKLSRGFLRGLEAAGVECHSFMAMSFPRLRRKMNFRNHRKIVVIDNRIAYTGGFNVGKEYIGEGPLGYWRDTHVRLEGDAVAELNKVFLQDWCFRTGDDPALIDDVRPDCACADEPAQPSQAPVLPIQVVASGVNSPWHPISQGFFSMISRAGGRVWITSPYLVPGASFIKALSNAALSGVDVRLLLPSTKDHFLVFWGSRSNYEGLLRAGVRIFLYQKGFVHAKTLLADDDIVSVGTCNLDARSLDINFESQLFIYDKELNGQFAAQFERDLQDSAEIVLEEWERRPFRHKMIESFARLYSAQI